MSKAQNKVMIDFIAALSTYGAESCDVKAYKAIFAGNSKMLKLFEFAIKAHLKLKPAYE